MRARGKNYKESKNLHEELQGVNFSSSFVNVIKQRVEFSANCFNDGSKKFMLEGESLGMTSFGRLGCR
jgi:hypothetical protein